MKWLGIYPVTLAVCVGVDFIWLSQMQDVLYRPALADLLAPAPRLGPAAVFYLLYAAGIVFFAVEPARDWKTAALRGLAFGLVAYGVYDLTNQATLKIWPLSVTLADMSWGAVLTGIAATAGYVVGRRA